MCLCFICSLAPVFLDFPFIIIYQLISNSAASATHRFSHLDFLTEMSPTLFHTKYRFFFYFKMVLFLPLLSDLMLKHASCFLTPTTSSTYEGE